MNYDYPVLSYVSVLIYNTETGDMGEAKLTPGRFGGADDDDYQRAIQDVREQLDAPWRLMTPEEAVRYYTKETLGQQCAVDDTPEVWQRYDGDLEALTENQMFIDYYEEIVGAFEAMDEYDREDELDKLADAAENELTGEAQKLANDLISKYRGE